MSTTAPIDTTATTVPVEEGKPLEAYPVLESEPVLLLARRETSTNILALIDKIAMNPDFDVQKVETLLAMQERFLAKNAEISFNQAMARLQPVLPVIPNRGQIKIGDRVQSRYALYEDIATAVGPLLAKEGFSIRYNTTQTEKDLTVHGTLSHRDGHSITAEIKLPLEVSGNKNATQAVGSTLSYGKRYLITMMLNLVTADDDADDGGKSTGHAKLEPHQIEEIERVIKELNIEVPKFLTFIGAKSVPEIEMRDFKKAMNALNLKRPQK